MSTSTQTDTSTTCITCNAAFVKDGIGTGYGIRADGNKICYQCCANDDRRSMIADGRITLYFSNGKITNWPGTLQFPVFGKASGRHNIAGKRVDVWFIGPDKHIWHGVQLGSWSELLRCKRTKETWVEDNLNPGSWHTATEYRAIMRRRAEVSR